MASIAELVVNLRASTASFATDLAKANRLSFASAKQIEASFRKIGSAVALAGASVAAAGIALISTSIDEAESFNKLSQSSGIAVETLSAWVYAAKIADVTQEDLAGGLAKLSKNMYAAATGSKEQAETFGFLKISLKDTVTGGLRPAEEVLLDLAEWFSKHADSPLKLALSMAVLGKAVGPQMIPFLNQGKEGIRAMLEEAQRFGKVISKETAQAAEDFSDNLKRLRGVLEGVGNTMMVEVLPFLNKLSAALVDGASKGEGYKTAMASVVTVLRLLMSAALLAAMELEQVGMSVGGTLAVLGQLLEGNLKGAQVAYAESMKAHKEMFDFIYKMLAAVWADPDGKIEAKARKSGKHTGDAFGDAAAKAAAKAAAEIKKLLGSLVEEAVTFGQTGAEAKLYQLQLAGATAQQMEFARAVVSSVVGLQAQSAVEKLLGSLRIESATFGETAGEAKLYELQLAGATAQQIEFARAVLGSIEGMAAQKNASDEVAEGIARYGENLDSVGRTLKESLQTPAEEATARFRELTVLLGTGRISADEFLRGTEKLRLGLEGVGLMGAKLGKEISAGFAQMIIYGRGGIDMLKSVVEMLVKAALQALVFKQIFAGLGGTKAVAAGGVGGFFAGLVGELAGIPGLQAGGSASAGQSYLVGEGGPEVFVPDVAGQIVSNSEIGGNTYYSYRIDARGADPSVEPRLRRVLREVHRSAVETAQSQIREAGWRSGA